MKRPLPPTYFFGSILLLGLALLLGSVTPFVVVPVYVVAMTEAFIKPEERMLEKAFGDRFSYYRTRVRRWL